MKTLSKQLNRYFDYKTYHQDLIIRDGWLCDKWKVLIENEEFEFHTGGGHRKMETYKLKWEGCTGSSNKEILTHFKNTSQKYITALKASSKPVAPNIDDVLYGLIIDSCAIEQSFEEWCGDFGYDDDSIKAKNIYEACQKNGFKLKRILEITEEVREAFQDY